MRYSIITTQLKIACLGFVLCLFTETLRAQTFTVNHFGEPCTNSVQTFYVMGGCDGGEITWQVFGGGIPQTPLTGGSIQVKWSSPSVNAYVMASCSIGPSDESNYLTLQQSVTPSVTISSTNASVCASGGDAYFTATPSNEGTNPSYRWTVNNSLRITTSLNNVTLSVMPGDQVGVTLVADVPCANPFPSGAPGNIVNSPTTITVSLNSGALPNTASVGGGGMVCPGQQIPVVVQNCTLDRYYSIYQGSVNLISLTADPITRMINFGPYGEGVYNVYVQDYCNNTIHVGTATITVNTMPPPGGSATPSRPLTTNFCDGNPGTLTIAAGTGTNYQWSIDGYEYDIGQTLTYPFDHAAYGTPGSHTVSVTYNVNGGTCYPNHVITIGGMPVTIAPNPTATAPSQTIICSGQTTSIIINDGPNGVSGTAFNWTVEQSGATNGLGGSGATIAQTLTNNTNTDKTVTYHITPSTTTCTGTPVSSTVIVRPRPSVVPNTLSQTFCSGNVTSIALSSNISGVSFNWTIAQTNVTGGSGGSGTSISQMLMNSSTDNGTATYTITPVTPGCADNANVVITVKPAPAAAISPSGTLTICSDCSSTLNATPIGEGYTYQWLANDSPISGAISSSYMTSTSENYKVLVTKDGCSKTSAELALTKNIKPVVNAGADQTIVIPVTTATITGSGSDADGTITYLWTKESGADATLSGVNTASLAVTNLKSGIYRFRLTVTDNFGEFAFDEIIVTVQYPPNNYNYIRETKVEVEGKKDIVSVDPLAIGEKNVTTNYFDGLGRPMQSVTTQGSPAWNDIVQPIAYDVYGREVKKYLPYTDGDDGSFKINALKDPGTTATTEQAIYRSGKQYAFYQPGGVLASDQYPYAETKFEPSPLNRPLEQGAAGETWQPDGVDSYTSTDHTVKFAYEANTVSDEVLLFTYTSPTAMVPGFVSAKIGVNFNYYNPNQLYKAKTKDEQQHEVIEFKDKEGRVILKKVQASDTEWAQTYYIYDDFGNLVVVLPPEAVKKFLAD